MMAPIKTLLITGKVTSEHDFRRMNENIRKLLESTGKFQVNITEEFNGATEKTLQDYDLLILNYDGKNNPTAVYERWDEGAEHAFFNFVKSGKGLVLYHSTLWLEDGLPDLYKRIWGMYFKNPRSRKCPVDDVIVKIANHKNAITEGIDDYMVVGDDFFAGIYKHPDADVNVLAGVYDDIEFYKKANFPFPHHPVEIPEGKLELMPGVNTVQPVAWTNTYGSGRVFAFTLGHEMDTLRRIGYLTMFVRGAQWAAAGTVTLDKPDRSGEKRFRSWPYY